MAADDLFQRVGQLAAAAAAKAKEPVAAKASAPSQLPLWPEMEAAMPNAIARSALFAPIAKGRRKVHDRARISSREDVEISYTGKQLDIADQDVFYQALQLGRQAHLGDLVRINRADFLRAIGRSDGKSQYDWLDEVMHRLKSGVLTLNTKRFMGEVSLINYWGRDNVTGEYEMTLDKRIIGMFSGQEYGLIDWKKRLRIEKRVDLSKWMQTYIASHARGQHSIGLRYLKEWSSYNSPLRKFREAMSEALQELERLEIIANAKIRERDKMVCYTRL